MTSQRKGFTLVEMLAVMGIIAILSSMSLFALWGANEKAKADRTKSVIRRVDKVIQHQWETYRTRRVELASNYTDRRVRALARLAAIRELQRMELPERKTDVIDVRSVVADPPTLWLNYQRICRQQLGPATGPINFANWTEQFQGAECLYLIMASMGDGEQRGLDLLRASEIGDEDGDGMLEVLDGWRRPLDFIRWPAGYLANQYQAWAPGSPTVATGVGAPIEVVTPQRAPYYADATPGSEVVAPAPAPDSFDPLKADPRWHNTSSADTSNSPYHRVDDPYDLLPLVYSGGPDRKKDIDVVASVSTDRHSAVSTAMQQAAVDAWGAPFASAIDPDLFRNDPYRYFSSSDGPFQLGTPRAGASDNLTNHLTETR